MTWFRYLAWLFPVVLAFVFFAVGDLFSAFFMLALSVALDIGYLSMVAGNFLQQISQAARRAS